jgi:hypothetical protein
VKLEKLDSRYECVRAKAAALWDIALIIVVSEPVKIIDVAWLIIIRVRPSNNVKVTMAVFAAQ